MSILAYVWAENSQNLNFYVEYLRIQLNAAFLKMLNYYCIVSDHCKKKSTTLA